MAGVVELHSCQGEEGSAVRGDEPIRRGYIQISPNAPALSLGHLKD